MTIKAKSFYFFALPSWSQWLLTIICCPRVTWWLTHLQCNFIYKVEKGRAGKLPPASFLLIKKLKDIYLFTFLSGTGSQAFPSCREVGRADIWVHIPYCGRWAGEQGTEVSSSADQRNMSTTEQRVTLTRLHYLSSSLLIDFIFKQIFLVPETVSAFV